ncbi:hypothetical protein [Crocosphaera chwakensis]|uniref:CobQ/CobB/MinD/ParA nucleotide binding domain-containing protein n=1 Tax=Crocosphaera chwakensis CCY0110 TaxID=391612 RepID=A3IZE0_9CHRO|nr:hypothetical protein [Crocosphaera chwakensis]EAZ88152.1 hypothetical protein CY0110_14750 [Crocosphaera chwakensis CCY0110]
MTTLQENAKTESNTSKGTSTPIKNLIIVGGEKGGTGKSYLTRHLIGFCLRKQWEDKITVFDADPSVDDVYQAYEKYPWMKKVEFSDSKYKLADPFDIYDKSENKFLVIVNLPSNIQKNFNNFFETFGLFKKEIQEKVYETAYYLFVSDGSYQSIKLFREHLQRYKDKPFIKTIFILNEGQNGQSESFKYLETIDSESSKGLIKEINDLKIPVLVIPELAPNLRYKIDELVSEQKTSFDEIVKGNQLSLLWSSHYQQYLEKINNLFGELFNQSAEVKYQNLQNHQTKQRTAQSLPI